jgi:hypothetical protein
MTPWIVQMDNDTKQNLIVALGVIATVFAVWFFTNDQRAKKAKEAISRKCCNYDRRDEGLR